MRKSLVYAMPLALVTVLAVDAGSNKAQAMFEHVAAARQIHTGGATFNEHLANEYRTIALFEADDMYDWFDAENHATKAVMAANGETPLPYDLSKWNIEDPAKMAELENARGELVSLLDQGGRAGAPAEAAVAQAKFDCWVEQQEEGHQPTHIAACRDRYYLAMEHLKAAMAQPEIAETKVITTSEEVARQTVYFDFDKSDIAADAQRDIDAFVAEMKQIDDVTLYIRGHADKSGPSDYNKALSARRAEAVRGALTLHGMTLGDVKDLEVVAEGEDDPAVQTADGVRHPLNRRVEIIAQGVVTKTVPSGQATLTK